jgi:hypothetical protein
VCVSEWNVLVEREGRERREKRDRAEMAGKESAGKKKGRAHATAARAVPRPLFVFAAKKKRKKGKRKMKREENPKEKKGTCHACMRRMWRMPCAAWHACMWGMRGHWSHTAGASNEWPSFHKGDDEMDASVPPPPHACMHACGACVACMWDGDDG